jgi:hypothetical protein
MVVVKDNTIMIDAKKLIEWIDGQTNKHDMIWPEKCGMNSVKEKIQKEIKNVVSKETNSNTES